MIDTFKNIFGILAVDLVHRECRYQSKMATQVEKAKCVFGLSRTILLQLRSIFVETRTERFPQRGKAFIHGASNSKKPAVCVKRRVLEGLALLTTPRIYIPRR
jgi:hypothetical protein